MSESPPLGPDPERFPAAAQRDRSARPARWMWAVVALLGALAAVAAMGARPALPGGFALGLLGCTACVVGLLGGIWPFGSREHFAESPAMVCSRGLAISLGGGLVGVGVLWLLLRQVVAGRWAVSAWVGGLLVSLVFAALGLAVVAAARHLRLLDVRESPSLWEHRGVWLFLLTTALYLPGLGTFGLIDPWESHYGEVAREMLARRDWISLWWAEDGWFWSKPILDFWAQGLSFAALGVPYASDQMLAAVAEGSRPAPEWAARFPVFVVTLIGQLILYSGVKLHLGRRVAWFGSIVLVTCPQWYFLARQSMVDMFYVAPVCAAMGLLLLAMGTTSDRCVRGVQLAWRNPARTVCVSGAHLLWGAVLACVVPQVLYLASRNISFAWEAWPVGYFAHPDYVALGSPGNCHLPGNRACGAYGAAGRSILQPIVAALGWTVCAGWLVWKERKTVSLARLYFLGAWLCLALTFMGKGAPGLVLVLFGFAGTVVASRRYHELLRCAPLGLVLIFACVAAPWFVQQYVRLGFGFVERLFLHDMVKRAFDHVHDTNAGVDTSFRYYIWQLGYALFPWSGVAAVGTLYSLACHATWPPRSNGSDEPVSGPSPKLAIELLVVWQLAAFGMFSVTGTKFHHYIFPLVPPAALLGGVLLNSLWASVGSSSVDPAKWVWRSGVAFGTVAAFCLAVDSLLPGGALGHVGEASAFSWPAVAGGVGACAALGVVAYRIPSSRGSSPSAGNLVLVVLGASLLTALVGRDLASQPAGDVAGQSRLLSLFCYTYDRPWPQAVDFRGWLVAVTLAAAGFGSLVMWPRGRRLAVAALVGLGVLSAAWGINAYLPAMASHWGQRQTIEKYYERRAGPEEPIVAYQLNWKGENFYTGNHIVVFKVSGKKFEKWVATQREQGVKVIFFATEHVRIPSLKRELGEFRQFELLTDAQSSSKFLMARVEL